MYFFSVLVLSVILSFLSVNWIKKLGHKYDILLYPQEDRWHSKPIAVHGGIGLITSLIVLILITTAMFSPLGELFDKGSDSILIRDYYERMIFLIALIGSAAILFIFGWLDDVFKYRASMRLFVQIIVSTLFIIDIGTFQISDYYLLNFAYTLLWFVGIINATNLMDCMDGLCSGALLISTLFLLSIILKSTLLGSDQMFFSYNLILILSGSLVGFLMLNFPPAKIFMGDSGSLPLGFMIAAITFPSDFNGLNLSNDLLIPILVPILLLIYPIFDTAFVTITRIMRGEKFYVGGKDHSCHRLVNIGFSERRSLFTCYSVTLLGGISALILITLPNFLIPIVAVNIIALILLGYFLGKIEIKK